MIRLGLMGVGVVASYGHIPAIQRTPGLILKSLFEPDSGRLMEAKARFGVEHGFTDPDLFFRSGIDAVVVTSPAPAHLPNVEMAARYGKPVLCEKPLAMTELESQRMIDVMRQANLPLYVGFTYRFSPSALEIKRLVRERAIGDVRSLRLIYAWDCHGKCDRDGGMKSFNVRRQGRMDEGGPMVDCGVHQIDLARWWLGSEIVRATGVGAWVDAEHAAPDHMYLHLDHAAGQHTMVEISYAYGHTTRDARSQFLYELIGTAGMIRYDRNVGLFEVLDADGTRRLDYHEEKNFDGMYRAFEQALRTGRHGDLSTADDGLTATRIARTATEAAMAARVAR
ncbi:MAG TPA: Gfo/Idh/MocA family oxidoreductase [Tepidisphaeraceae bacterium]|nr:Gfo/Idh/MocA family oxidoreductase [Tepidisphaeraceae bacterium]